MPPEILFVTSSVEDYLADGLLHGMKNLLGRQVVDYPKAEHLYEGFATLTKQRIRGHGMTLYTAPLADLEIDRSQIEVKLASGYFDLVVFSAIDRQYGQFLQWMRYLDPSTTVLIDGSDSDLAVPYLKSNLHTLPHLRWPTSRFPYYKREWTGRTKFDLAGALLARLGVGFGRSSPNLREIAFSIPEQKILPAPPVKSKLFCEHIVDEEVRNALGREASTYAFSTEQDYYDDLAASRFGITTKRGGWDCLRHYELAINHTVPCFRDLDLKEKTCAPHGLSRENCIVYHSAKDLFEQCDGIGESRYRELQEAGQAWIRRQTTVARAAEFLADFNLAGASAP